MQLGLGFELACHGGEAVAGATSKLEHEMLVTDPAVPAALFGGLDLRILVELTNHCTNYRLPYAGYRAVIRSGNGRRQR